MRHRVLQLAAELGVSVSDIVVAAEAAIGLQIRSATMLLREEHAAAIRRRIQTLPAE